MAGFWQHYAQANDDIRTELIDRAWFDRRVGSNAMESDVQAMQQSGREPDPASQEEELVQDDPAASLYGEAPSQSESAQLYGYDALEEDDQDQELSQRL